MWVNEIFIGIQWYLTIAYYLWLTSISHASKSFFFFPYIFILLFCSFAPTCIWFSSFFFLFLGVCGDIFKLSILSFNSHKLFFLKLSIRIIKPKRNHFGIKLYLSVCCIPLSFVSTCISFFLLIISFCVWIFSNFSVKHKLFFKIWIWEVYQ